MKLNLPAGRDWLPLTLRRLMTGWFFAATLEYLRLKVQLRPLKLLSGIAGMELGRVLLLTFAVAALLTCIGLVKNSEKFEKWFLFSSFAMLSGASLWVSYSVAFLIACAVILVILAVYALRGWRSDAPELPAAKKSHWLWPVVTAVLAVAFFWFVSFWTVSRYRSFCSSTYDFGIFAQMFHYMKETGLPLTTLERDGLMSHFQVHMSPIYSPMLPFYCIFPDPAPLQALQAAVLASAAIPMWLIGKRHGLSGPVRMLLCALLLLYPALSGGTSYDIHENCFLTPLILWLLWAIDSRSTLMTAIFAALTLTVKEDAAVYVAVIALWMLLKTGLRFARKDLKQLITGAAMLAVSLIWFFTVTGYLAEHGDGVMAYRYDNFMFGPEDTLIHVVWAVILCPMKALYEAVDPEKLTYIGQTLVPLLALPLITRRYERYLLLIPYLLVNLMSDYQYQHDILFQYSFGSAACLLYLTAVNLADLRFNWPRIGAAAVAVAVSVGFFSSAIVPVAKAYPEYCKQYEAYYGQLREILDKIPEDASVSATTFNTAYLSQRDVVYDIRYTKWDHIRQTEYVVMKKGSSDYNNFSDPGKNNGYEKLTALLINAGYTPWETMGSSIIIYHKPAV